MSKIIVITTKEYCERKDEVIEVVSHGVNVDTLETVILPNVSLKEIGAYYCHELSEFVLNNES